VWQGWELGLAALLGLGLAGVAAFRFSRGQDKTQARLRDLGTNAPGGGPRSRWAVLSDLLNATLPTLGRPLLPPRENQRNRLQARLVKAGLHHPQAVLMFLGVRFVLLLVGGGLGLAVGLWLAQPGLLTALGAALGLLGPGLWLDWKGGKRQSLLRRGIADALDLLVLCLEGGLSFNAALPRVTSDLQEIHPELGIELAIAQREMLLGLSAGEAIRKIGVRSDIEEIRSLASVLLQSERYGASVVKALRIYADMFRQQRQQRAEEQAQKAAVNILFPTLLCIFPAIFVVILGPAALQIKALFDKMK
jgi:tight adherence protein C